MERPRLSVYAHALRVAARNNASAFGFSIMITASLAALAALDGNPALSEVFLFALGAVAGFIGVLALAASSARKEWSTEPTDVVILAAALNGVSVLSGVGVSALAGYFLGSWVVWLLAPLGATVAYTVVSAIELSLAEQAEDEQREDQEASAPDRP